MLQVPENNGTLDLAGAIEVFDQLADMEDIAFGYTPDGCYARAHIMCKRMIESGLTPGKAWAREGEDYWCLQVNKPDGTEIQWSFHVAPTLSVALDDGHVIDMVIDPSLFDAPVTTEEWGAIMNTTPDKVMVAAFGSAPPGQGGDYTTWTSTNNETDEAAARTMDDYRPHQVAGERKVFPSQVRQAIQMQDVKAQQHPSRGKTWVTGEASPKSRALENPLTQVLAQILGLSLLVEKENYSKISENGVSMKFQQFFQKPPAASPENHQRQKTQQHNQQSPPRGRPR